MALKGKPLPRVAALVEAMFMAELESQLLTAGHDLAALDPPLRLDVGSGSEAYTLYNGQEQTVKAGDMYIADARGILSSILAGPDRRARIAETTRAVVFTVYGVPGISREAVDQHLARRLATARLISPAARVEQSEIVGGA